MNEPYEGPAELYDERAPRVLVDGDVTFTPDGTGSWAATMVATADRPDLLTVGQICRLRIRDNDLPAKVSSVDRLKIRLLGV